MGCALGLSAALSLQSRTVPLVTLMPKDDALSVECVLLGDPVPFGPDRFRVSARALGLYGSDGAHYSASGTFILLLPARVARVNLPGYASSASPYFASAGLVARFSGRFLREDLRESNWFESTALIDSEGWTDSVRRARAHLRRSLMHVMYARGPMGGFLLALLSGNRDYLEPALAATFRSAGLSHVLALSGMHLSIVGMIVVKTGRKFGHARISVKLSLVAMFFFVWFAGASPSLDRAIIMAVMLFGAKALGFEPSLIAILALAGAFQLTCNPSDVESPAFILSYLALAGILLFSEPISTAFLKRIPRILGDGLAVSFGAQIATCAYTAAIFGVFVPVAPVASLIVGPLATVFLSSGIVWLLAYVLFPPLAIFIAPILEAQYRLINTTVSFFGTVSSLPVKDLSGILVTVILSTVAGAIALFCGNYTRKGRLPDAGFAGL